MLRILTIFLILLVGFFVGPLLQWNQGSASFTFASYIVEMSFTTFLILLILFLFALYLVCSLLKKFFYSKTAFGNWLHSITQTKANKQLEQAQLLLLEGSYQKAITLFSKSAKSTNNRALSYLFDAQSQIDADKFVDAYRSLEKAFPLCKDKEKSVFQLIQLRLQIKNREYDVARNSLDKYLTDKPTAEILKLAYHLYLKIEDYKKIIELLPLMYKAKIYDETELEQLEQSACLNMIEQLSTEENYLTLIEWWKMLPKTIKQNKIYHEAIKIGLEPITEIAEVKSFIISLK